MENTADRSAVDDSKKTTLHKSLAGGQWYLVNMVIQKIFVFGTFFILARLLTPADFGLIALVGIVPTFLDALTAISFETALIQKKEGEEREFLNVVWTFSVLRGILLFLIILVFGPFIAQFFHAEQYLTLFHLSGLFLLFQGFGNIGTLYFFRNLDFKKVFLRDMAMYGTISILSILGALWLGSYWALFIANTAGILVAALISYALHSYRPSFDFSFKKLRPLLPFSQWVFGQELLNQGAKTLEDVLVGRFTDPTAIGLLSKAKALSHAATSPVASVVSKISFSAFARVQDSLAYVREGLYKNIDLLSMIGIPFMVAIYIAGHRLILILLGAQWTPVVPVLNILIIAATLDTIIISLAKPTLNALGSPKSHFIVNASYLGILICTLPFLVPTFGIMGAAIALLSGSVVASIATIILIHRLVTLDFRRISESLAIILFGVLLPLPLAMKALQTPFANTTLGFLLVAGGSGLLYAGVVIVFGLRFKKGPYHTVHMILRSFITTSTFTRIRGFFSRGS